NGGWMVKPSLLYTISANTDYPDEAAEFLNFILNDGEAAKVLGTTRGIPASHTAEKSLEESGLLTGLAEENDRLLDELDTVTISPYMELAQMKSFYNSAIEQISFNAVSTEEAAREMYFSINDYLERIKK
ncbi:MAG: carbohydrate ABC transporter substrate-binding protein, partial [Ruminococcus sp.]|nr:carbohydrate ABC transporter substrate-binding protein [Ruminococcus sp.]